MTDRARGPRRLAALGLVPLSAGAFGGAMVWAGAHDPLAGAAPAASPTPVASSTTDPQVAAALAEVADARARIVSLQAILDQRAAAAAAGSVPAPRTAGSAGSAGTAAGAAPAQASPRAAAKAPTAAPAPARAAAPAPRPAPPPVQTTTKASG